MIEPSESTDYLTIPQAEERYGVRPRTLRRRIAAGELPLYRHGVDRRLRLVKVADLDALTKPQPVDRQASGERSLSIV